MPSMIPPLVNIEQLIPFGFMKGTTPCRNPIHKAEQLVIVIAPNHKSDTGHLFLFEKHENDWKNYLQAMPCSLGKNGMAWGDGLLDNRIQKGQHKKEGDMKTPVGIFDFGTAFGYAKKGDASFIRFPYTSSDETFFCVDDPRSVYYNQIVSTQQVEKDWDSKEDMLRKDDLYEWGIFVQHNTVRNPQNGSCIHLHVWRKAGRYTAGCTAVSKTNMKHILTWLHPQKNPKLVQATAQTYPRFQAWFDLPEL